MDLEITVTPRETLVWAPTSRDAELLRCEMTDSGYLVLDADPWELDQLGLIPDDEHLKFDPARILNVGIGPDANASLQMLVDSGHVLVWHRWQTRLARKVWGVAVSIPRRGRPRSGAMERAEHFGIKIRGSRELGLRISRDTYARINKRSSMDRWYREVNPELWDSLDDIYEDAEHRILTDDWCAAQQERALQNYDLNMTHFASLGRDEFESALQKAVKSQRGMVEVTDLTKWDGVPGLYIMVLDEYRQVYVGATNQIGGVMARIKQHWGSAKQFDRLIWGDVNTSILSIDSFRALDTTRIFAVKTARSFDDENPLLDQFSPEFVLNRIVGGRDATKLAGLFGINAVMKRRDFATPSPDTTDNVELAAESNRELL